MPSDDLGPYLETSLAENIHLFGQKIGKLKYTAVVARPDVA